MTEAKLKKSLTIFALSSSSASVYDKTFLILEIWRKWKMNILEMCFFFNAS